MTNCHHKLRAAFSLAFILAAFGVAQAQSIQSLQLGPNRVVGGEVTTGLVTLDGAAPGGGATVSLSDNSSAITIPSATVIVAAGDVDETFAINTSTVMQTVVRQVFATYNAVTKGANLTLTPGLSGFSVNPTQVVGGESLTGTVTIFNISPNDTIVQLSDNSGAVSTPALVTIPAGSTSADFTINTSTVGMTATRQVRAALGAVVIDANLTLTPGLNSISVNPDTVVGGNNVTGMVSLLGAAPPGGTTVAISDNSGAIGTPANVTVLEANTFRTFTITTLPVVVPSTRQVFATLAGVTKGANLTLLP